MLQQKECFIRSNKKVVIFGTMNLAQIACKVCEKYGKTILGFCDNNPQNQGKILYGKKVYSYDELCAFGKDIDICICAFKPKSITAIKKQLVLAGFQNLFTWETILYLYQCEMKGRKVTTEEFCNMAKIFAYPEQKLIMRNVSVTLTERCTLCCKDCGALIPYYKKPKDYDASAIIAGLQELSNSVDAIQSLGIMGGEPFLCSHLVEVCEAAVNIKNARLVTIVTNGTLVPKDDILRRIAELGITITISDYQELSVKKTELCEALDKFDIPYELFENDRYWYRCELPIKKNRTREENINYYNHCFIARECPMLREGKLFPCGWHSSATALGVYSEGNGEFIDLLDTTRTSLQKRKQIQELFYDKEVLDVCDYCTMCEEILVERAVQDIARELRGILCH